MSRRRRNTKREILPDPRYHNTEVAKFINVLMTNGKKSVAERLVYGAMDEVEQMKPATNTAGGEGGAAKQSPVDMLKSALANIAPQVEVRSRRVGGANYQVPVEVRPTRAMALAMRWLRDAMREGKDKSTVRNLATAIVEAANGQGAAMKKREDTHRMAAANKAFSHFRF